MKIPTLKEYQEAKLICKSYEDNQDRLENICISNFKEDLIKYFENNLIDGHISLKKFELRKGWAGNGEIIPIEPSLEENYEGSNNEDIKKLCEKHNVNYSIVSWCYHK